MVSVSRVMLAARSGTELPDCLRIETGVLLYVQGTSSLLDLGSHSAHRARPNK